MKKTGVAFDERCSLHRAGLQHPESPERLTGTIELIRSNGTLQRCIQVTCREATYQELTLSGPEAMRHVNKLERMDERLQRSKEDVWELFDSDTGMMKHTLMAAKLSVGGLIDMVDKVMQKELDNGFAIVRPPGHHADNLTSTGFCIFNTVGLAIQDLQRKHPDIKIALFDYDVHFSNGTCSMFIHDPNVLTISIHRYDHGAFYPGGSRGGLKYNGKEAGRGFHINLPLNQTKLGDYEYMKATNQVVVPILKEFHPDIVFISAGYDAGYQDPVGGNMCVSTAGFAHMTAAIRDALEPDQGIVMALEGGYNVDNVSQGVDACIQVLLGDDPSALPEHNWFLEREHPVFQDVYKDELELKRARFQSELEDAILFHARWWPCLSKPGVVDV